MQDDSQNYAQGNNMFDENLHIVIIGGSLAGLWTGVVTQRLPNVSTVTIIERSSIGQLQDLGAGIRSNPESVDAIRHYCHTETDSYASHLTKLKTVDENGEVFSEMTIDAHTTTWGQLYRLFRETFQKGSGSEYRLGCKLEKLQQTHGHGPVVVDIVNEYGQHEVITADIVIGADGASSTVRALLNPDIKRNSVGYCCYRGVVPMKELSSEAQKLWDHSGVFHRYPASDRWQGSDFISYVVPGNEASADQSQSTVNWAWYRHKTEAQIAELLLDRNGVKRTFSLPPRSMQDKFVRGIKDDADEQLPTYLCEAVQRTREPFAQLITDCDSGANVFMDGKVLLVGDAVGGQRPHTGSAFLQATFHAIMVGRLLEGKIDLDVWSKETRFVSSILVDNGKELANVVMNGELSGQEKAAAFTNLFIGTQVKLNAKWKELIGIGDTGANF